MVGRYREHEEISYDKVPGICELCRSQPLLQAIANHTVIETLCLTLQGEDLMLRSGTDRVDGALDLKVEHGPRIGVAYREAHSFISASACQNHIRHGYILNCLGTSKREDDCVGGETLINVACRRIEVLQHRHETITLAVCPPNETPTRPNVVYVEANTTRMLANCRTVLQSVIDSVNAVLFHRQKETGRKLLARCSGIEEGGRGMCEEFL